MNMSARYMDGSLVNGKLMLDSAKSNTIVIV